MLRLSLVLVIIVLPFGLFAQGISIQKWSLSPVAGSSYSGGIGIGFTAGQVADKTHSNSSITLYSGFESHFSSGSVVSTGVGDTDATIATPTIYPNPNNGVFYIREMASADRVSIIDMNGRNVPFIQIGKKDSHLRVQVLGPNGIYFVITESDSRVRHVTQLLVL